MTRSSVGNALRGVPCISIVAPSANRGTAHRATKALRGSDKRPAVTLFELTVALFLVTTAMVATVQLLAVTAKQRRTLEHRRIALQEIANQAERVALLSWDETAPDRLTTWQPSEDLKNALPAAVCTAEVTDESGPLTSRRIRLLVAWPNAAGQLGDPLALSVWKFSQGAAP